MKRITALVAMAGIMFITACSAQRAIVSSKGMVKKDPTVTKTDHFIFWGLAQTKETKATDICGSRRVSATEAQMTFLNGLLAFITAGIYSPRDMKVFCE